MDIAGIAQTVALAGLILALHVQAGRRMDRLSARMDRLSARLDRLAARVERLESTVHGLAERIARMEGALWRRPTIHPPDHREDGE